MTTEPLPAPPTPAIGRQLALPFPPPATPAPRPLTGTLVPVRPRRVWASLAPASRAQIRRTWVRISQELAHDAARRS
jgi:hypothetical protein